MTASDSTGNTTEATPTAPPTVPHEYSHSGRCPEMPTAINIDVMYAEAGLANYHPIYMIVGARIT